MFAGCRLLVIEADGSSPVETYECQCPNRMQNLDLPLLLPGPRNSSWLDMLCFDDGLNLAEIVGRLADQPRGIIDGFDTSLSLVGARSVGRRGDCT